MAQPLRFLLEVTGIHTLTRVPKTFYFTDAPYTTPSDDVVPDRQYRGRIEQAFDSTRSVFTPGSTSGRSTVQRSQVRLYNHDRALTRLRDYAFGGQTAIAKLGEQSGVYLSDYPTVFVGSTEQPDISTEWIVFQLRDAKAPLLAPFQPNTFAGTGGLEGGTDLAEKQKPVLLGSAYNFSPICVDTVKEIYQANDGPIAGVASVENQGAALLYGGTYASAAELQDDALTPAYGSYKVWLAGGYVRINTGGLPKLVTMSGSQGMLPANRTHAQLFAQVIACMGASVLTSDITALDAKQPAECGLWLGSVVTTAADMCDRIAASCGCGWGARNSDGLLRIVRLEAPSVPVLHTIRTTDVPDGSPPRQESTADAERGRPAWRVSLKWGQNYTVQRGTDVISTVTPERIAFVSQQWRTAAAEDPDVQTVFLDAVELTIETLFAFEADALTEARRVLLLRKTMRYRFTVVVHYTLATAALDLFDSVGLAYADFGIDLVGLNSGRPFVLLGVAPNAKGRTVTLTLWGNPLTQRNLATRNRRLLRTRDGRYLITRVA